ncbi:MAG: FecR family protein [Steroidobacteraceae bacterium]
MSSTTPPDDTYRRRLVEAAAWRAYLTEAGRERTPDFDAWLAANERNRAGWDQVQGPWDFFGEHATSPELMEARRRTLGRAQAASRRRWRSSMLSATQVKWAAAAAGAIAAGLVTLLLIRVNPADTYRTGVGERRTVLLADSSKLTLDAETEVRVRLGRKMRELELIRGQARFDVAHDARRPFSVLADGEKVVATGTAFDVDLLGPKLLVTLIEGRLTVVPDGAPTAAREPRVVQLTSGQQLVFTPGSPPVVGKADLERATSWEKGQLVFDRINRYSKRPLTISDPAIAELKISGICDTDDIEGFVTTITEYLPVREVEEGGEIRLESR